QQNFDPHNRLSGTATEFQQKSHQTGSEVIAQQIFQISTPNLVCTWKTKRINSKDTFFHSLFWSHSLRVPIIVEDNDNRVLTHIIMSPVIYSCIEKIYVFIYDLSC